MKVVIVTGGSVPSKELLFSSLDAQDFVIGVDKGCDVLYKYKIKPSLILGDFDSIDPNILKEYKNQNIPMMKFNPEKDYTDTDLAYEKAKEVKPSKIIILGATGSRMDHTLGNIGILLKAIKEGYNVEILDENNRMFIVDKASSFTGNYGDTISFHAISNVVTNFNIWGAKYNLSNYNMTLFEPRAVCNEFLDNDINISFDSGMILVIYSRD